VLTDTASVSRHLFVGVTNQKHNGKIRKESEHDYFNSISLLKNSMAVWPTWSVS
jgi:hypothetical protein